MEGQEEGQTRQQLFYYNKLVKIIINVSYIIYHDRTHELRKSQRRERGTGNGERGTGNGERGMGNGERGMGNGEWGTGNAAISI